MKKNQMNFEESMHRLEEIVKQLESGNCSLEEAIQYFQEGNSLVESNTKMLEEAELSVKKLIQTEDNTPKEVEFYDETGI